MRKPKEGKSKVDLLKPVFNIDFVTDPTFPDDCFGTELYNPRNKECSVCSEQATCANVYSLLVQKNIMFMEHEHGPFIDQIDLKAVDWEKLKNVITKYAQEGEPLTFKELIENLMDITKCDFADIIIELVKRELPKTNLVLEEGYVKRKN